MPCSATPRASTPAKNLPPKPPVSPSPASRRGGLWSAEAELSPNAEANASVLQRGRRAAPLSHPVGEGLGVRAKKRERLSHNEPKPCTLIRPEGGGSLFSLIFANCGSAIGKCLCSGFSTRALRASGQPHRVAPTKRHPCRGRPLCLPHLHVEIVLQRHLLLPTLTAQPNSRIRVRRCESELYAQVADWVRRAEIGRAHV